MIKLYASMSSAMIQFHVFTYNLNKLLGSFNRPKTYGINLGAISSVNTGESFTFCECILLITYFFSRKTRVCEWDEPTKPRKTMALYFCSIYLFAILALLFTEALLLEPWSLKVMPAPSLFLQRNYEMWFVGIHCTISSLNSPDNGLLPSWRACFFKILNVRMSNWKYYFRFLK